MPIRRAIAADIPAILALEQTSATAAHYSRDQYAAMIEASQDSSAFFQGEKERRFVLVLAEDSSLKGFLVGRFLGPEWEVENIVVSDGERRKGLGSQLVVEFLNIAKRHGGKKMYLEVREHNQAARELYIRFGFVATGRRRRYYKNPPEDAVLYSLSLE